MKNFNTTAIKTTPEGLSSMINNLSLGIEPHQVVRELVWNGIQAIQRDGWSKESSSDSKSRVCISRSKLNPKKLVIANIGGDALTYNIAIDNLAAIGCSGHGDENNFGVGAKISYLPGNKLGLTYLCRSSDIEFTIGKGETNYYGFQPYFDEDDTVIGETVSPEPENWTYKNSETEVILNGSTDPEDTWVKTCSACSFSDTTEPESGHQIANYLKKKIWDSSQQPPIYVSIYNKEGEFVKETKVMGCLDVKKSYENEEGAESGHIVAEDGTKIHFYARKFRAGKKVGTQHPAGFVATVHANELYIQPTSSEYARKTLMRSFGIQTHDKHVAIILEPPEGKYTPTVQRGSLVDAENHSILDIASYAKFFRENMPDNLRKWMKNLTTPIVSKVEDEARELFSVVRNFDHSTKTVKFNSKQKAAGTPKASGRVRKRKPASDSGGFNKGTPPSFNFFEDDQDDSTSNLDIHNWNIGINKAGNLFVSVAKQLFEDYRNQKDPNITLEVVEQALSEEIYLLIARCYVGWRGQRPTATQDAVSQSMQEGSCLENVWIGKPLKEYYKRIDKIFEKKQKTEFLDIED